tara:strand:- start:73 stop:507 length:435 start_codon:yes stop_codon:yes gene_type:complete
MLYAIRQIFLKGGTIKDAIAYVVKQTGNMPTKLEGLQMIKMYQNIQKDTAKIIDFPRDRITPFFDEAGEMSTKGKDIVKEGLAGLEKKTLLKDSPERIAKIKADNKAAVERLKDKKKTVEDFSDDGDFDPGGMAQGGLAKILDL